MSLPPLIKRIYSEFSEDRIPAVAAGITFFFLLALFPAIASVVSLYGLFADRQSIMEAVQMVSGFLPEGAVRILRSDLYRLVRQEPDKLGWAFALGFVIASWSASGGVKALLDGLNIAFERKETRGFFQITLNTLLFTALAAVLGAGVIFVAISGSQLSKVLPFGGVVNAALRILVWPVGFCVCSAVISLVYRFGANRPRVPWRWITWGSAFASSAWILGTAGFSWYVANFGRYDRTYGDLGAAVGFLTWIWLSLVILLLGAEIICEIERTAEPEAARERKTASKRRGRKRAPARRISQDQVA